ncbi:hypothetical protein HJC23_002362 [Cyclotella cryptica]|uniref:Uncharacterized protein n=1 Tax=Cyclotella cryptica TaxID=29204 RepID=A0ABD3QKS9_9STRA|eukprot:CCRYP_004460-RA/>CCRYP_004460-RA protein AED:0.41 eAED:0.33 QI:0/-1/0/1/-1/1/1/0/270
MFSPVVNNIVRQEMENDAKEIERTIFDMESALQRALDNELSHSQWTASYRQWDRYEDTDELTSKIEAAKNELAKIRERINRLNDANPSKMCSHRFACSCSGNKQAEREVAFMSTSQRLKEMHSLKENGNAFFGHKNYLGALALYEKSLLYFEYCLTCTETERKDADSLRLQCLLNAAACFLELKMYHRCIEYCTEALEIDPMSIKAFFRRARAFRLQHNFDAAEADLMNAKNIECRKADFIQIERESELLKDDRRQYETLSRNFARRAMA